MGRRVDRNLIVLLICIALAFAYLSVKVSRLYLLSEDWFASEYFRQDQSRRVDWSLVGKDFAGGLHFLPRNEQYRPLFGVFFTLNYTLFGFRPGLWHLFLLSLHGVVAALFALFAMQVLKLRGISGLWVPALAALLFLLCPQNATCMAWFGSCMDVTCVAASLGALILFGCGLRDLLESRVAPRTFICFVAAMVATLLAFMSKENSIALAPALFVHAAFIVLISGKARASRSWLTAAASLVPFVILEIGYLLLRTALFGNPLSVYGESLAVDWPGMLGRLRRFLSTWFYAHNPFMFVGFSNLIRSVGGGLWIIIVLGGLVFLAAGRTTRRRLGLLAHVACVGLVAVGPVLWRLDAPPFGSTQDSYFLNGMLCIMVAILLGGPQPVARAESDERADGRAQVPWGHIGEVLVALTIVFWGILLTGNLKAYEKAGQVTRELSREVNDLADSNPDFTTFSIPNVPRFYLGVTCAAGLFQYLQFPFRSRPSTIYISQLPEKEFFLILRDSNQWDLVEREQFFREARRLRSSRPEGGLLIEKRSESGVTLRCAEPVVPNAHQYVYVQFRKPELKAGDIYFFLVNLYWMAPGRPALPYEDELQNLLIMAESHFPCELLYGPGHNPLYGYHPEIVQFALNWRDMTFPRKPPLELQLEEATVFQYPP